MRQKLMLIDPDVTQRQSAPYWAATLVLAMRSRDLARIRLAQRRLRALGCPILIAGPAKVVPHA